VEILLVITVIALRHRKAEAVATWVLATIGLLTVVNIAIAVTLRPATSGRCRQERPGTRSG